MSSVMDLRLSAIDEPVGCGFVGICLAAEAAIAGIKARAMSHNLRAAACNVFFIFIALNF